MKSQVKAKLKKLPQEPGVYFFRDRRKKIIYVGKAANLKNRVRSYFAVYTKHGPKNLVLVSEITDLEWMETASEIDALFLESEMIKRYMPKFNVDLKDEKSHLYVKITIKAKYPTVMFVRRPLDDGAIYFGPYMDGGGVRRSLKYLRRIFPYNTHEVMPARVCLQYHLGLCPGLEENKTTPGDYRKNLHKLMMFLRGERTLLIKQLEKEMRTLAKTQQFEAATVLRNQAHSLRSLGKQIIFSDVERFDVARDQALNGLTKLLDLKGIPRRIETYDISHISGSDNVASMVVFLDGVAAKSEYRKFKMRTPGNDDFAHMAETMSRRFSATNLAKWPKPDLLVIDGGKGQLTSALKVLDGYQIAIPTIGLAKREETIIQKIRDPKLLTDTFKEIKLPRDSEVLKLLQRMRDEAHRFAVSYHTALRKVRQTSSSLEDIPGIGPATRKKLIKHFGSLRGLKKATSDEIDSAIGKQRAKLINQHLAP